MSWKEIVSEKTVYRATYNVSVTASVALTDGTVDKAIMLSSQNQYAVINLLKDSCFADLDSCTKGLTLSTRIKFTKIEENTIFLSSGSDSFDTSRMTLVYRYGRFHFVLKSEKKAYYVSFSRVSVNKWSLFEFSFNKTDGLLVYVDNALVAKTTVAIDVTKTVTSSLSIAIGNKITSSLVSTAQFAVETFELYGLTRTELVKSGVLIEGKNFIKVYNLVFDNHEMTFNLYYHVLHVWKDSLNLKIRFLMY